MDPKAVVSGVRKRGFRALSNGTFVDIFEFFGHFCFHFLEYAVSDVKMNSNIQSEI